MSGHDGRQGLQFVHQNEVLERTRSKEEGLSFLQWHGRRELWFFIVVSEMSYLIEIAGRGRK
jgi:hypothetical protein